MNLYPNIMIYRVMVFSDFGDSDFNYNNGKGEREGVLTFGLGTKLRPSIYQNKK